MIKKNLRQSSLWLFILKLGKKFLVNIRDFSQTYPNFLQSIQLTFIYLFAFIDFKSFNRSLSNSFNIIS